jgi:hypothetical protein
MRQLPENSLVISIENQGVDFLFMKFTLFFYDCHPFIFFQQQILHTESAEGVQRHETMCCFPFIPPRLLIKNKCLCDC